MTEYTDDDVTAAGRIIVCEPAKDCADPHVHRWYCMRGHPLDDKAATPGVCPLSKCDKRGANG